MGKPCVTKVKHVENPVQKSYTCGKSLANRSHIDVYLQAACAGAKIKARHMLLYRSACL